MKAMSMLVDHEFIILVSESSDRISESGLGVTASGKRMRLSKSQSPQNRYHATPLGKATTLSGLPPSDAVIVLESLQAARRRLVLKSGFHSVFLSTPPSTSIMPNWSNFEILLAHLQQVYPVNNYFH